VSERPTASGGTTSIRADITLLKRREAELHALNSQLEAGTRAKTRFLSMLSHELRTPMNGILGIVQSLLTDNLTPDQRTRLEIMLGSVRMLTALLDDMLDVSQVRLLNDLGPFYYRERAFISMFSNYLSSKKIPHDLVVCVRRDISSLTDIVLENELEYLIRVKKGNDHLYFTNPDIFRTAGSVPSMFQDTEAYAIDRLLPFSKRVAKKITLPSTAAADNEVRTEMTVTTADLPTANIAVKKIYHGSGKLQAQYEFLDVFDAIEEDKTKNYPEVNISDLSITNKEVKKYEAARISYLEGREKKRLDDAKKSFEGEYDFALKELTNFKILHTGRYGLKDEFTLSFDLSTDELIKKTGPNFIVDIGKLIENQVKIDAEETTRAFNVYFDYPRAFSHLIVFEIPAGYEVQGVDKLNMKVENHTGGFTSTAKVENGKVIIESYKHYDKFTLRKDDWSSVVSFLNAADNFTGQKILLRKKG